MNKNEKLIEDRMSALQLDNYQRRLFKAGVEFGRNESKELYIAATQIVHLHLCEQEGIGSGQPTPKQWLDAVDKLSKAIHP